MKNPLLLHDLLYIGEHQTCNHYRADVGSGFIYEELEAGETERLDTVRRNHLLILLEGRCSLDCNQFSGRDFSAGEMILVPRSAAFSGRTLTRVRLLDMAFEKPESGCDRLVLQSYHTLCRQLRYDFRPTEIRYPLTAFFDLLVFCLKNGMSCAHLHEMKHRELFFYLRGFYSKEEIAGLFYPIVSRSFDFRNFVFENYRKVHSLKDLIDLSPMSRSTFLRRFKSEFNDMAHDWMLKQTCQRIVGEIACPETTIKDLMTKFGFDSHSSFNRFCKANFHCTPSELIRRYRKDVSCR